FPAYSLLFLMSQFHGFYIFNNPMLCTFSACMGAQVINTSDDPDAREHCVHRTKTNHGYQSPEDDRAKSKAQVHKQEQSRKGRAKFTLVHNANGYRLCCRH